MLNPPITGNDDLDSYLYQLNNQLNNKIGVVTDTTTGEIYDTESGQILSYLYKYMQIKYADDRYGTGLTDSPTGKYYYGLHNEDPPTESTDPNKYQWYRFATGFGTTYFIWYIVNGGRNFKYVIDTVAPSPVYAKDIGTAIDLDVVSSFANLTGPIISVAGVTFVNSQTGTGSTFVMDNSPTLITPNLGTPSTLVGTNISGTAASLTAGHVTTNANLTGGVTSVGNAATVVTNANLTGPITSVGNATSIASQTGTGSKFVVDTSPTLITPNIGAATGTSLNVSATLSTGSYTVAGLPGGTIGDRAYVTNALAPVWGNAVVGGGAVVVPVFRNATVWIVG